MTLDMLTVIAFSRVNHLPSNYFNHLFIHLFQWLPLLKDQRLQTGEFSLPVTLEYPPSNYSYISPDVLLPGIKWVDNHKSLFTLCIEAASSVHCGVSAV